MFFNWCKSTFCRGIVMPSEYSTVQDKEDAERKAKMVRALNIAKKAASEIACFDIERDSFPAALAILAAKIYEGL